MTLSKTALLASVATTLVFAAGASASAQDVGGEAGTLTLRDMGYMMVGVETTEAEDGSLNVSDQMFVGYALPAEPQHDYPLVLVHGGGGQSTDWLGTPDGRDGWADYFIAAGFDTYWVDRPGYGRSPANSTYGEVGDPANTAFIAQLATSANWPGGEATPTNENVVRWAATSPGGPYGGNELAARDISLLLEEIGPAILVLHSAGGPSGFWAADMNPENVAGIIAFEASGNNPLSDVRSGLTFEPPLGEDFAPEGEDCLSWPGEASTLTNLADIPVVLVGSENRSSPEAMQCSVDALAAAGVDASYVYMNDEGIEGTGHFMMAETNNAESAQVFIDIASGFESE